MIVAGCEFSPLHGGDLFISKMIDLDIKDEFGGIDEEIKSIVEALNLVGINTTSSCAGHSEKSAAVVPWVKIRISTENKTDEELTSEFLEYEKLENGKLKTKVLKLLDEFYGSRVVDDFLRIRMMDGNVGFWIYNGGDLYPAMRKEMDERLRLKDLGEQVNLATINAEEIEKRREYLPKLQKEFSDFAEFILSRKFINNE